MAKKIGQFIQQKVRSRNLEDKDIAKTLNITVSAVRKIYPLDDLHINRVLEFCKLLDEDLIHEFYYAQEPLKSLLKKTSNSSLKQIKILQDENIELKKTINQLEDHIKTLKELVESLKK